MRNFNVFFFHFYWTPICGQKGPVKWVCPFVCPSYLSSLADTFLGAGSFFFLQILHSVRGPYGDIYKDFFKSLFWAKMIKSDPDRVFSCFSKIKSLFLPGNALMLLWHFAKTACVGKIQYSIYSKKYSQPVKSEYSLIISTSWMNWFLTFFLPYG